MPEYQYECARCGESFVKRESLAEHAEPHAVQCPKCGSAEVARVLGTVYVRTSRKA